MDVMEDLEVLDPRANNFVATRIELPTPHKVAVLILIQNYLKAKKAAADVDVIYPTYARRNFCMLLLKLIEFPDMTYNELHDLLTTPCYRINNFHMEGFERAMSDMFTLGVEGLFDFAETQNIEKMLSEQLGVSQFSLVGLYIRRVGIVLEGLSFPERKVLYKNVCLYYEKGVRSLSIAPRRFIPGGLFRRPDSPPHYSSTIGSTDDETQSDIDAESTLEDPFKETRCAYQKRTQINKWSRKQADLFILQQAQLLETNELCALSPIEIQDNLVEILHNNQLNPHAYFLWAMNQLRLRDYFGCMEAFHRAFDRCPAMLMEQSENKGFQYFSINLAIIQSNFKHREEALLALKESIMLSQEDGDRRCLSLANSWLRLLDTYRNKVAEKSPAEPQNSRLMQILALGIMHVVKYGRYRDHRPLDLFALLTKSEEVSRKNSVIEHFANSIAIRSGLWCLYGRYELSALYAQSLINLKKKWPVGDYGNLECIATALASVASFLSEQGEYQMSAVVVSHAHDRFRRYPNKRCITLAEHRIGIYQALYRCDWTEAMVCCSGLYLLEKFDGNLQRARIYIARGYNDKARTVLRHQIFTLEVDLIQRIRTMVLQAYVCLSRHRASAETFFQLIRAYTIARDSYMGYEVAYIQMVLAQTLLALNLKDKAFQAINSCIETICVSGSVYDRAVAHLVYAKCFMAVLTDKEPNKASETCDDDGQFKVPMQPDGGHKREHLMRIARVLERTAENLKLIEGHAKVLDIYAFLSKSFYEVGDYAQRNRYACMFKLYYQDFPITNDTLGLPY